MHPLHEQRKQSRSTSFLVSYDQDSLQINFVFLNTVCVRTSCFLLDLFVVTLPIWYALELIFWQSQ